MKTMLQAVLMAGVAGSLLAQVPAEAQNLPFIVEKARDATVAFVHDISMGPIVKNAPYSAEAVTETIQQLYDGNRIVQRETSKLYRDGQGRERREEPSGMQAVFISDPVAGLSYTLHPETQTAEQRPFSGANAGVKLVHTDTAGFTLGVPSPITFIGGPGQKLIFVRGGENVSGPKEESLGTRILEGVQVEGTRNTTTIPAGAIGNEREIEIVDERWFSPDLQMTVMTRHADPRSGETVYKLSNIQRVEQVRSLFEVPTGYTINDGGGRGGRGAIFFRGK